jgi:hypothetical protein
MTCPVSPQLKHPLARFAGRFTSYCAYGHSAIMWLSSPHVKQPSYFFTYRFLSLFGHSAIMWSGSPQTKQFPFPAAPGRFRKFGSSASDRSGQSRLQCPSLSHRKHLEPYRLRSSFSERLVWSPIFGVYKIRLAVGSPRFRRDSKVYRLINYYLKIALTGRAKTGGVKFAHFLFDQSWVCHLDILSDVVVQILKQANGFKDRG